MIAAIVLAAGEGRRFGGAKQLAPFRGRPLLESAVHAAVASSAARVCVVLGARAEQVMAFVDFDGAVPVACTDWREGQAASLRTGISVFSEAEAVVVVLGDQPLVTAQAIDRLISAREPGILAIRATYEGVPGHPVLFERPLFTRLQQLSGDVGGRVLLEEVEVRDVVCDELGIDRDIDRPEDLVRLEDGEVSRRSAPERW